MMKNVLILAILGALIGSSVFSSYIQSVTAQDISTDLNITKAESNYCEKGFIYGRISKISYFWGLIAFEAVKIHVITFHPFNFYTYLTDTKVSVLNGYKGFISNHSLFIWGEFSTIPAESNIINLVVNKRDPENLTVQWVVADVPFIQRDCISWDLIDVNNTNATGTNVTMQNWDELCTTVGDTYNVQVQQHGMYTFCLTYEPTGLLLFKSEPELY